MCDGLAMALWLLLLHPEEVAARSVLYWSSEDGGAWSDLRGVHGPVVAVAERDGETCSKFRSR